MKYLKRCEERNTSLSEDEMWEMVESFEWEKDHDYDRIQKLIDVYPKEVYIQLYDFVSGKESELYDKYKEDWLGDPGIEASDDAMAAANAATTKPFNPVGMNFPISHG